MHPLMVVRFVITIKLRDSKMILKILASVFTGIGGHYLNRKWDKAILFLCLFVLYLAAIFIFFTFSLQNISTSQNEMASELKNTTELIAKAFSMGILLIWIVSLTVTILDDKNKVEPNIIKWTKSGITGAALTSILSSIILVVAVAMFYRLSMDQIVHTEPTAYESKSFGSSSHNFYENLYFGGLPSNSYNLPAPPSGEGIFKGKISYLNNPAEAVTLSIVLNSKYRAKNIVTDADGTFTVSLPPGTWTINSIQTESWENKPKEGSYTMYYGGEEKLEGRSYNRHKIYQKAGYPANVTNEPNTIHINATINKDIHLTWPNPNAEGVKGTINDAIRWEKYPGATRYYVEIKNIRREGSTTHYKQVTSKILSNKTTIPLSSLKYNKTKGKDETEYAADIYAFSEDGTLIAEFSDTYKGGTFLLSDGNILIEDDLDDFFDLSSIENPDKLMKKIEAISLNKRRATAVSVLIDDNMLNEAESLLNLIDSKYAQGKKEVLSGYILALQGECSKSNEMFDKALSINPNVCIPDTYKGLCD